MADDEIRGRLRQYRDGGVATPRIGATGDALDERLANVGLIVDLVAQINAE